MEWTFSGYKFPLSFQRIQRLANIGKNVLDILNAHRESDKVGSYTGLAQLVVAQLAMSVTGRMEHTSAGISHMSYYVYHLQTVHKTNGILARSFQSEGHDATTALRQIFFRQSMIFIILQATELYPCHTWVAV